MAAPSSTEPSASSTIPPILFYKRQEPYYQFSNFADYPIDLDGFTWPTNEHYFQAAKFTDEELKKKIRTADGPGKAFKLGRNPGYKDKLRKDWDSYRLTAMRLAVHAKFTQHKELRDLLLGTGAAEIVEDSPVDAFWGVGSAGNGKNWLGRLLMELRAQLVEEDSKTKPEDSSTQ
jgi:ribA/ribD-fused uncharacterized protein